MKFHGFFKLLPTFILPKREREIFIEKYLADIEECAENNDLRKNLFLAGLAEIAVQLWCHSRRGLFYFILGMLVFESVPYIALHGFGLTLIVATLFAYSMIFTKRTDLLLANKIIQLSFLSGLVYLMFWIHPLAPFTSNNVTSILQDLFAISLGLTFCLRFIFESFRQNFLSIPHKLVILTLAVLHALAQLEYFFIVYGNWRLYVEQFVYIEQILRAIETPITLIAVVGLGAIVIADKKKISKTN